MRDKLGLCQWFHYEAYDDLDATIAVCRELQVRHLRTGISWADYYREGGKAWYDHQMKALQEAGLEVLLSIWHTPPSISEGNTCASPPKDLKAFADFIDEVITSYSGQFAAIELWNEPNNRLKWNFLEFDPMWRKFAEMIGGAAYWCRQRQVKTVLGGIVPVDPAWLEMMDSYGMLQYIDVVAIHGFPGMWWSAGNNWDWNDHWEGWADKVQTVKDVAPLKPVWITETGLATWDISCKREAKEDLQVEMLNQAAAAPVERVYWYCAIDLDPEREAIEGFHVDENEYHLGLVDYSGNRKNAFYRFQELLAGE